MSALCQTRRFDDVRDESGSPPIAAKLMRCGERPDAPQPDSDPLGPKGARRMIQLLS
jgi:hypothetical protein